MDGLEFWINDKQKGEKLNCNIYSEVGCRVSRVGGIKYDLLKISGKTMPPKKEWNVNIVDNEQLLFWNFLT